MSGGAVLGDFPVTFFLQFPQFAKEGGGLSLLHEPKPSGLAEVKDHGEMSPSARLMKSRTLGPDLTVEGNDGGAVTLELEVVGLARSKIVFCARRVAVTRNKVGAIGMKVVLQVGGFLGMGKFLEHLADATADVLTEKAELVLMGRGMVSVFGGLAAQADERSCASARVNENMRVQVVGIVMEAVAVANGVTGMELLLKAAHRALDDSF